ncbi:MAG: hypothetical protein ACYDBB_14830 [Armatimonadota bacterium]
MTTDEELISEFMRERLEDGMTILEVAVVRWDGPHTPYLHWRKLRTWRRPPTPEMIETAQQKAFANPKFFQRCEHCHERCNAGHMCIDDICQGCAERDFGIVF